MKNKLLQLPDELFDIIREEAFERRISMNALIILVLTDHVRRKFDYESTNNNPKDKGDQ